VVARFPAGLAVYWITTSLWTLGQQLVLWRLVPAAVEVADTPAPAPAAPRQRAAPKRKKHGRRR
jgi:YidC/Oxa1 family membrane protein insertase